MQNDFLLVSELIHIHLSTVGFPKPQAERKKPIADY